MGVCSNRVTIAGEMTELVGEAPGRDLGIAEIGLTVAIRVARRLRRSLAGSMTE